MPTCVWCTSANCRYLLPPTDLYAAELTDQGTNWLAAAETEARATAPALHVHTEPRTGRAIEELADESEDATMVVVGSRRLGGFRNLLLGSVANTLTALANCPIVVIRGRTTGSAPPDAGPVVVGADGTAASTKALEFALAVAAARGADVLAVHAWTYDNLAKVGAGARSSATASRPAAETPSRARRSRAASTSAALGADCCVVMRAHHLQERGPALRGG